MSQDKGKSDTGLELTKAFIACGSGIAVACVTGVFGLVAVFGPQLLKTPTPVVITGVPQSSPALGMTPTASTRGGGAVITNAVIAQDVKAVTFDPIGITTTYSADQRIFHAVVTVLNAPGGTVVKAVWTAVDVGSAAPPNTWIQEAEIKLDDIPNRNVDFAVTPVGERWPPGRSSGQPWLPGKYRADIYLNGKLDRTLTFSVAGELK